MDRTQAIQRLRADWNQIDPVGEARLVNLSRQREPRRLKRISCGDRLVEQIAARCIRDLARDSEDLNKRIASLDAEIAQLLAEHGNPVADPHGAGTQIAAAVIARAGDLRRFRDAAAFARRCAPHQSPAARAKPPAATAATAAATGNSTPPSTAAPPCKPDTTHQPAPTPPPRSPKARRRAKRAAARPC